MYFRLLALATWTVSLYGGPVPPGCTVNGVTRQCTSGFPFGLFANIDVSGNQLLLNAGGYADSPLPDSSYAFNTSVLVFFGASGPLRMGIVQFGASSDYDHGGGVAMGSSVCAVWCWEAPILLGDGVWHEVWVRASGFGFGSGHSTGQAFPRANIHGRVFLFDGPNGNDPVRIIVATPEPNYLWLLASALTLVIVRARVQVKKGSEVR